MRYRGPLALLGSLLLVAACAGSTGKVVPGSPDSATGTYANLTASPSPAASTPLPSVTPEAFLMSALAASAKASSFHLEAQATGVIRPLMAHSIKAGGNVFDPTSSGKLALSGNFNITADLGKASLTGIPGQTGTINLLTGPGAIPPTDGIDLSNPGIYAPAAAVYLATPAGPAPWRNDSGLVFTAALGVLTAGSYGDPARAFSELTALIEARGLNQVVLTREADQTCPTGLCYQIRYDASAVLAGLSCGASTGTRCPDLFTVDFTIDPANSRIEQVKANLSTPNGTSGAATYTFSAWNQPVSVTLPASSEITIGDGVFVAP